MVCRFACWAAVSAVLLGMSLTGATTRAAEGHWQRVITYQDKRDLFANYYVGPQPSGTAAQMYVSPLPVPANVGHTYVTYQPLMPHEYMYKHTRSHYAYTPGAGWYRSKVRWRTCGLYLQDFGHALNPNY
jgi:hypothetical protein